MHCDPVCVITIHLIYLTLGYNMDRDCGVMFSTLGCVRMAGDEIGVSADRIVSASGKACYGRYHPPLSDDHPPGSDIVGCSFAMSVL
eukprot:3697763-Rhodomonas_salina.1